MDERLQKAYEFSNYRLTLDNEIKQLKIWLTTQLTHSVNGGAFLIDRELISFVHTMQQMKQTSAILLDTKQNPIVIENIDEFFTQITEKYFGTMNEYHSKMMDLRKKRNVKALVEVDNG